MTKAIDAWVHDVAPALGVGFTEVIGARSCVQPVAGIAETIKGVASREPSSPSQVLSMALSVGTGRIAVAPDPRIAEHDPRNEGHRAHESE